MRCLTALVLALPVALLGCGKSGTDRPAARATASQPTPASTSSAPTPSGSPTVSSKVKDCFDGDCLLAVSKPVTIPLDKKRYYYPKFAITAVTSNQVSYRVDYPQGGHAEQRLSVGNESSFGFRSHPQVNVRLVSIAGKKAVIAISPGTQ